VGLWGGVREPVSAAAFRGYHAIGRSYGANIEAHWYVARYVLPGNVQKVILKPKQFGLMLPRRQMQVIDLGR
jgi:hypothetical protein